MVKLAVSIVLALVCGFTSGTAEARQMKLTIYDDGKSCPGNCDAHVVINNSDNGTRFAFAQNSTRESPEKCRSGEQCVICFSDQQSSCMKVTYRGSGPPSGKFDFTPAFYNLHCGTTGIPEALESQCKSFDRQIKQNGYDKKVNCLDLPDHAKCNVLTEEVRTKQREDNVEREICLRMGEAAYNRQQANEAKRRALGCNYSAMKLGGPNRNGVRWRKLLPGACRAGTFVGRDGLDCCSGDIRFASSIHPECARYFPEP